MNPLINLDHVGDKPPKAAELRGKLTDEVKPNEEDG